jgi:transglutaminase-like putative cysteine protease
MKRVAYRLLHRTEYHYAVPVPLARHVLHLRPRDTAWQEVSSFALRVSPVIADAADAAVDAFGNPVTFLELLRPHSSLLVESEAALSVGPRPWATAASTELPWEAVPEALVYTATAPSIEVLDATRFVFESPYVHVQRELAEFAAPSFPSRRPLIEACTDLMRRIHTEFEYVPAATEVGTSVIQVLAERRGVCQDFAHLMIGSLRALGLAARYVSGYLRTAPPPGKPHLLGADASHAWVAVFVPGLDWVEFDPTNDCLADERHLLLGWGRDFGDVSPVSGVIQGGGDHTLVVGVTVEPVATVTQAT